MCQVYKKTTKYFDGFKHGDINVTLSKKFIFGKTKKLSPVQLRNAILES